jgi:hypothetical protein
MDLNAHGIKVDVPPGWDGEIYRRKAENNAFSPQSEQSKPVVHLANFPLLGDRGDFGSGAVETMRADNILIVLFEFGSESVGTVLFRARGIPTVAPGDFAPHTMQRPLPGQSGAQYFFAEGGRAFCLYVVLGSHGKRRQLVPEVNQILSTLDLG